MFSYTETIAATHQQEAIKRVVANAYRASGLSTEEGVYRIDSVRAEPVDSGGLIPDPEPSLSSGVFVPFFGVPALTSKFVPSLVKGRKAEAVRMTVNGPVSNLCPASVLQRHAACTVFLDPASASGLA